MPNSYDSWLKTKAAPDWSHKPQDVFLINNTNQNTRDYDAAIRNSIATTGKLPAEFEDIFTMTPVGVDANGKYRVRLEMA